MRETRSYTADERSMTDDAAILMLWNLKFDTLEIARRLQLREFEVANRLLRLRQK